MKKYLKWIIAGGCGLLAAIGLLLGFLLGGCDQLGSGNYENTELYWNIDGTDYLGVPGKVPMRRLGEDGLYTLKFAVNGSQERIKVHPDALAKGIDVLDVMNLVFDDNGVVVDIRTVDECTGGYFAKKFYVEEINGTTVICNSASMFDGYRKTFEMTDDLKVYLVGGTGPLVGMPTQLAVDDIITAVYDKAGNVSHAYVEHLEETPDVYWNVTRMWNSTTNSTTRESDILGTYTFEMAMGGGPVTVKTRSLDVANSMDAIAPRNMVLTFDEDGFVTSATNGSAYLNGAYASWYWAIGIENNVFYTIKDGTEYSCPISRDFTAYDVSGRGEVMGEITQVRPGDRVHCLKNSRNQACICFVINRKVDSEMYWNIERMWDDKLADTTRVPDGNGWYTFNLAVNGEHKTYRTQDRELVVAIDSRSVQCFGLALDGDVITAVYTPDEVTGGSHFASYYDVTEVSENKMQFTAERTLAGADKGTVVTGKITKNTKILDVSKYAEKVGETTTLRVGDRIRGQTNYKGELEYIHVMSRLPDSPMYWLVDDRMYDSTNKVSTRQPAADGYYYFKVTAEGKQYTYRTKDKTLVNEIDAFATKHFGLKVKNGIIVDVYTPREVVGGGAFASWYDVTNISEDGEVTALRTLDGADKGKEQKAFMHPDCKVYDVSTYAEPVGYETTLRIGDRIQGERNAAGQLMIIYVVGNRSVYGTKLYWNLHRQYDSVNKVTTRVPDAEGWYHFELASGGKTVYVKTKDAAIATQMDARTDKCFALKVNSNGEVTKAYPPDAATIGKADNGYDITGINGRKLTLERMIGGGSQGTTITETMSSSCKIYNVSGVYASHAGEATTLRLGDRIYAQKDQWGNLTEIFVTYRMDLGVAADPNHTHCECVTGVYNGAVGHTCNTAEGWAPWTQTDKLPMSGNWYLTCDVTTVECTVVPKTGSLKLCLNGHTINGPDAEGVFGTNGDLVITDCQAQAGSVVARYNQYGGILYMFDNAASYHVRMYAGTLKNIGPNLNRSGGIIYAGTRGINPVTFSLYGGTILAPNVGDKVNGGGVHMLHKAVFNMYGGLITGGHAANGGNVNVDNGTFNMLGGTISGGTAASEGGNVRVSTNAVFNLYGGTITGGGVDGEGKVVTKKGGNFQVFGTLNVFGGTISGGKAINDGGNISAFNQANIVVGGATERVTPPVITGGVATNGGNINMASNKTLGTLTIHQEALIENGQATTGRGGNIRMSTGTVLMDGGKVTGGNAGNNGGNFDLGDKATMTLQGGTVEGGIAGGSGGNIAVRSFADLAITGGTVTGGTSTKESAGNVFVQQGTVKMTGGEITGGTNGKNGGNLTVTHKDAVVDLTGGTISGGNTNGTGGNIYVSAGTVNIGGEMIITGGTSAEGGNLNITGGTVNMAGGKITDGEASSQGGNVRISGGSFVMTGGQITGAKAKGGLAAVGGTVALSGSPKITGNADGDLKAYTSAEFVLGDFTDGAEFNLWMDDLTRDFAVIPNKEDAAFFHSGINGCTITVTDQNVIKLASDHPHCLCAGLTVSEKAEHTCEQSYWVPFPKEAVEAVAEGGEYTLEPGYYYLKADVTFLGKTITVPAGKSVSICLNGKTFTSNGRFFTRGELNVTDCSYDEQTKAFGGSMITTAANTDGCLSTTFGGATINIYGGNFTSDMTANTGTGGLFYLSTHFNITKQTVMNVYNGKIYGGISKNGGNIYVAKPADSGETKAVPAVLNIYGGEISGGNAGDPTTTYGGNIYISGGNVNIYGGKITEGGCVNGPMVGYGGNIYINSGTLKISSGEISKGFAKAGGNLYINGTNVVVEMSGGDIFDGKGTDNAGAGNIRLNKGTLKLSGGRIWGGEADADNANSTTALGGSIYVDAGTFEMTGGTIGIDAEGNAAGGNVKKGNGGNLYINGGTVTLSGGTIANGQAASGGNIYTKVSLTIEKDVLIKDGVATGNGGNIYVGGTANATDPIQLTMTGGTLSGGSAKQGGSIYNGFGKVMLTGGTINCGTATERAGGIYTTGSGGTVTVDGCTISGGTTTNTDGVGGCIAVGGTLNVISGSITGGTAPKGGCIYVFSGATLNMSGGTVSKGTVEGSNGGIHIDGGNLNLSGTANISGNNGYNLKIKDGSKVTLGDFSDGAQIYVTLENLSHTFGTLTDTTDKGFFYSDSTDYTVGLTADNKLQLVAKA